MGIELILWNNSDLIPTNYDICLFFSYINTYFMTMIVNFIERLAKTIILKIFKMVEVYIHSLAHINKGYLARMTALKLKLFMFCCLDLVICCIIINFYYFKLLID